MQKVMIYRQLKVSIVVVLLVITALTVNAQMQNAVPDVDLNTFENNENSPEKGKAVDTTTNAGSLVQQGSETDSEEFLVSEYDISKAVEGTYMSCFVSKLVDGCEVDLFHSSQHGKCEVKTPQCKDSIQKIFSDCNNYQDLLSTGDDKVKANKLKKGTAHVKELCNTQAYTDWFLGFNTCLEASMGTLCKEKSQRLQFKMHGDCCEPLKAGLTSCASYCTGNAPDPHGCEMLNHQLQLCGSDPVSFTEVTNDKTTLKASAASPPIMSAYNPMTIFGMCVLAFTIG